jgi:hypothetical protein
MAPRLKILQSLYLEPGQAEQLDALAVRTRIPKAVLLREAVDDLLAKHGAEALVGTKAQSSKKTPGGRKPGK